MNLRITLIAASTLIFSSAFAQNGPQVQSFTGTSLEFIPNKGQVADTTGKVRKDILYLAHSGPVEFFLRQKGLSYVINTLINPKIVPGYKDDDAPGEEIADSHDHKLKLRDQPFKTCRVDMDFVGASVPVTENNSPTEGYLNFYYAHCPQGITNVKAYDNVVYKGIYPGIDVSYKGSFNQGLKYDIIVSPGSDPEQIRMKYTGTENVEIKDGKLQLTAYTGKMEERIPKIYQEINGMEVAVEGQYVLYWKGKDSLDGSIVGIKIKNYNKAYPLVIDPWWASYCGGSGDDEAWACALDYAGNTLVTGSATSSNYPVSVGAFQNTLAGGTDLFVIKFNTAGQRLWATYYGGSAADGGFGITTDLKNNVFVTGNTSSTNFPVSVGAFQPAYGGGTSDGFAIKFDPNGNRLWGTYCGGSQKENGTAIITDNAGNCAITGYTLSPDFPVSLIAFQTTYGGGTTYGDAYLVKFDPNGNQLWGTYFGGTADDGAFSVCADNNGNFAITGLTQSTNFPISTGCWQSTPGSAFVAKFDPNGNQMWATYFGGIGNGCAADKSNNIVIAGAVGDGYPYYSWPCTAITATAGVYETTNTTGNGFAAKFSPTGNRIWTTFNNTDVSEGGDYAMTVDEANNVYLEDDEEPPSFIGPSCAFQRHYKNGSECCYIVKLDSNAQYSCSTYTCGTIYDEHEYVSANLATKSGRMAIAGYTSGGIPTTPGVFQTTYPGSAYAPFVFNLCSFACGDTAPPALTVTKIVVKSDSCLGYVDFSAHASAPCDSNGAIFLWSFPGGNPSSAVGPNVSDILYNTAGTYTATVKYIACGTDSLSQTFTIKSGFHDSLAITNPANCHETGKATVYPSSGDPPYTYHWSNGTTTQSDTGLGSGSYTCVVSAANGCRDTLRFNITNPVSPPFITKPRRDTGICTGGHVQLNVSAGTNFTWAPSGSLSCSSCTNPIASPTATTVYTITGIDTVGCPDSAKITVTVDSVPVFSITATQIGCGGYTQLYATSSSELTWLWSPGTGLSTTTSNVTDATPPSQITYTLTANNGFCSFSDTITIAPIPTSFPLTIKAVPDTVCQGAIISLTSSSPNPIIYWGWRPIAGLSCNSCQNTQLYTALLTLTSNTYTIALEAEDSTGCIGYDTITLHINSNHITGQSTKICEGASATLTSDSSHTYKWNTGATTRSITVMPTVTTTYYVIVDSGGCTDSIFYKVNIDKGPPITLSATKDTVCPGSSTNIIGLGPTVATWSWLPNTGLTCYNCHNPSATVNSQITYTVTCTDSTGCVSKDSITLNTISNKSSYTSHFLCKGSSIILTVTDGNSYLWSNGATTSSITVSPSDTTSYYAVVSFNGGCSDTAFQTVDVHTGPDIALSLVPDSICIGKSANLSASSTKVKTWSWSPYTTLSCRTCPDPVADPTVTTTYVVSGTDSLGCTTIDSVKLKVNPLPVAGIIVSKDTVCPGDSVLLIGKGGGTYKWSNAKTTDSIYVTPISVKTYTLTVNKNGCIDSITKTIHMLPVTTSTVTLSRDSICPGDTTVLSVSGGTSYTWSNGSTLTSIIVTPEKTVTYTVTTIGKCQLDTLIKSIYVVPSPVPVITGKVLGCKGKNDTLKASGGTTYKWSTGSTLTTIYVRINKDTTITLKAFNGKCYADTSISIVIAPTPIASVTGPFKICAGDTVTLTAKGGGSYSWNTGSHDSTIVVTPTVSTTYSVVVTDDLDGCTAIASSRVTIDVPALFACCDSTIISGNSAVLFADSSYKYTWYPSTGVKCDSCTEIIVSPTVTTTYTVIGVDKTGCEVARIITIVVEPPCVDYFVPNVFTPNNDGVNDFFKIKTEDLSSFSIYIYDRWGKEMFKSTDPDFAWDGLTEGGDKASDGVYYYIITSICNGTSSKKHGYLQLIR